MKQFTDYLKNSVNELKKVSWPTREDTIKYSYIVIIVSLAVAIFFGALDYVLNIGFEYLVGIR
ncbi:MAG: preprotein translocase subunit SecE [Parcubacteria group bacterium]|nr:preprotein translocase subunit SecE [Parcubacteria group bacterium]